MTRGGFSPSRTPIRLKSPWIRKDFHHKSTKTWKFSWSALRASMSRGEFPALQHVCRSRGCYPRVRREGHVLRPMIASNGHEALPTPPRSCASLCLPSVHRPLSSAQHEWLNFPAAIRESATVPWGQGREPRSAPQKTRGFPDALGETATPRAPLRSRLGSSPSPPLLHNYSEARKSLLAHPFFCAGQRERADGARSG